MELEKARRVEELSGEFKVVSAVHVQMIAGSRIRVLVGRMEWG